ncbi:MAG: hypothetical protein NVS9B10_27830 [Nevskia sp.]
MSLAMVEASVAHAATSAVRTCPGGTSPSSCSTRASGRFSRTATGFGGGKGVAAGSSTAIDACGEIFSGRASLARSTPAGDARLAAIPDNHGLPQKSLQQGMARKPAHEQFDTLKAIQDRAFDLFGRYGYDGVSIGDIAKAARLSKGALYWHYASKEALYLDCLKRLHALFDGCIFDPMRDEQDPARAVLALFSGIATLLRDPLVENGIAGFWLIPASPETAALAAAQRAFELNSMAVIQGVLSSGVEQGRFDLGGDLEDMSRAIISVVEAVVLPLRHQTPEEVGRTLRVLARTLFRAYDKTGALPQF